ncbi:alpha/beta hydrolase [Parabacteroides sp. FAFU027]|uniref:alpha/beta hydrolase n=1 Tax=Parabacteroides sp. FAFU027 TaxID=2922715 RepID=UPI001FAFC1EC|nr:alpha/beta hydrolase [Parabacteroides sp. FAFU027]
MNLFITNREIVTVGTSEMIRSDGKEHAGDNLRFGEYLDGKLILFPEPENEMEISYVGIKKLQPTDLKGSSRFFKQLYDGLTTNKGDVLFFIHGFNTDLNDVKDCFDRLNKRYVIDGSPIKHIVIFTWPSKSPDIPLHYRDDQYDAQRSGITLARCFEKVVIFFNRFLKQDENAPCQRHIHLMAHSMGNQVLEFMLLSLPHKYELFREIILVAADVEYTIFDPHEPFEKLIDIGYRVHIYFHEHDVVLDISKYTKNFNNRLGRYGRKSTDNMKDVFDIDVTHTKDDFDQSIGINELNHWYYYSSTDVVKDIIRVLNGKDSKYIVK